VRILMISDVYFPRINGVSTSIWTFAKEFVEKGHQVTLIAPDYGQETVQAFEVIRIPSRFLPVDPEDRILRARSIRELIGTLRQRGFDILHIHTPFIAHYEGLRLARALGIPVVESYHTFFEEYLDKYIRFLPRALLRAAARRFSTSQCNAADGIVVPSQAMCQVLRNYGVTNRMAVIPTGIESRPFEAGDGARFRRRQGIPPDRPVMVHVGRLAHEKNLCFLIDVLAEVKKTIPNILLLMAGEGPARASLERRIQREGLAGNALLAGYLKRDGDLQDCYCAGDVFVFSSRTETQGLVLLEAMALGVPVVSTAVMGTKEVLDGGHGAALIAEEEVVGFAAKAIQLLCDPGLRARMGQAAVRYAGTWSAPALADKMLDEYRQVMDETALSGPDAGSTNLPGADLDADTAPAGGKTGTFFIKSPWFAQRAVRR